MTGSCQNKSASVSTPIILTVTGNRNLSENQANGEYRNISKALVDAFNLTTNLTNATVNIYLNPDVDHYILFDDVVNHIVPMRNLISPLFNLNILYVTLLPSLKFRPSGCTVNT